MSYMLGLAQGVFVGLVLGIFLASFARPRRHLFLVPPDPRESSRTTGPERALTIRRPTR